jgi:hypothetical protein
MVVPGPRWAKFIKQEWTPIFVIPTKTLTPAGFACDRLREVLESGSPVSLLKSLIDVAQTVAMIFMDKKFRAV